MNLWQRLFGHVPDLHVALPAAAISIVLALVFTQFIVAILRRMVVGPSNAPAASAHKVAIRVALRLLAVGLVVCFTVLLLPPVLEMFGEPLRAGLRLSTLKGWLLNNGLRILIVLTLAYLLLSTTSVVVARLEKYLGHARTAPSPELAKRARTLGDLIGNAFRVAVVGITVILVLGDLGVNTTPILTGAGILGLAVGFGAQTLVKDIISGFFMILENQVRVGDVAEINGTGGLVEGITLRTIVLRDARGAVQVFANGSINSLANLTKDFAYAVLDVVVHYRHDTDEVVKVLQDTAATVEKDPAYASSILAPLEVLGIESLGDTGVTIRVRMKTQPQRQWDVARELRRRIKKNFADKDIEIPFAQPTFPGRPAKV